MFNFLKRWRENKSEAAFTVAVDSRLTESMEQTAQSLRIDGLHDREKTIHPGVVSLEGEKWAVHAENGTVYLSGEDGLVQAQFAPVDAYSLGTLLQESSQA